MAAATCTCTEELEEDQTEDQTAEAQTEDQALSTSGDEQYLEKVTMKSSDNKTCDESKEVIASDDEELERSAGSCKTEAFITSLITPRHCLHTHIHTMCRLALEAILKKAKQDKLRADREGPCGW